MIDPGVESMSSAGSSNIAAQIEMPAPSHHGAAEILREDQVPVKAQARMQVVCRRREDYYVVQRSMLEWMEVGKQQSKASECKPAAGIVEFHYTAPVTILLVLTWSVEGREEYCRS